MDDRALDIGPGEVVAEKYRVLRELGRGGMGVVLAADHLLLGHPVALKVMRRSGDPRALERFRREARILVKLQSQHACKMFDVGALADGTPFMVMELLEGDTLGELVRRRGWLGIESAVDLVLQASEAIAEAHSLGVVHRDLKPENLFATRGLDGELTIKVLDFGISKIFAGGGHTLTDTGELLGSPRFMAPEQLQHQRRVDLRADVWALGVVLYELLTGQPAFHADTMAELLVFILQDDPEPIASWRPEVPRELANAVARCLEKDADRRFSNVAELATALGPFASERGHPYVERIRRIVSAGGWSPSPPSSAPPTAVDPRPPSTTAVSERPPSTAPTAQTRVVSFLDEPPPTAADDHPAARVDVTGRSTMPSLGRSSTAPGRWRGWLLAGVGAALAVGVALHVSADRDEEGMPRQPVDSDSDPPPVRRSATAEPPTTPTSGFAWAPRLLEDAIERNEDHAAVYGIMLVADGFAQFELQHPRVPHRVQRHTYRGAAFEATTIVRLSDDERASLPKRLFPAKDLRIDRLVAIAADAVKRVGDPEAVVERLGIRRIVDRRLDPTLGVFVDHYLDVVFYLHIELPDRELSAHYWADGSFRCSSIGNPDFPAACPKAP